IEGTHIYCPKWKMTLTPKIGQLTTQNAVVHFHVSAPQWGKELFECSAAIGESTQQALDTACVSFLSTFIDGIVKMENGEIHEKLETTFAGKQHRWNVSLSNVAGLGPAPDNEDAEFYWNQLKDGIVKRLGNQKLCYVKVYAAKSFGNVTGECRIDDIKSEELSALVAKIAEKWNVRQFASHKSFFFIRQEEETVLPYAYLGPDGYELLKSKVKTAVLLFHACKTQEQYELLPEQLRQALCDATLANECYSFLPEMCTENAFPQMTYAESIQLVTGYGDTIVCYKNQLADYWSLHAALFSLFEEGIFGDAAEEIYNKYISVSASYGVVQQMYEKGGDDALSQGNLTALLYQVEDDFEIR
ncbi:MAG: hypothetical protein K2G55_19275, partial [Lachnospiraceae bacterium]|nr:hypothetical protein [Lachnospiraceae bacterium]